MNSLNFDPTNKTVIGVRFGSAGNGADIFGVFGTTQNPEPLLDWGDAPDTYGTLNADNGPRATCSRGTCSSVCRRIRKPTASPAPMPRRRPCRRRR